MSEIVDRLDAFVSYASKLKGDEKGEAQVFCDRLFQAFGHGGVIEAGATLEARSKGASGTTRFLDLLWKPRVLLEMKKKGEKLALHFPQAFDYWVHAVPDRPRYVVLCNFSEFWIYDFDKQVDQPMDIVALTDLPKRYPALNFLLPSNPQPLFDNDREAVSREAAIQIAQAYRLILSRLEMTAPDKSLREAARVRTQRFILQAVIAMFAEDIDLLPSGLMLSLINDCIAGQSSYDLFGALFRQMNSSSRAQGGRFSEVHYFNGGLFAEVDPIDLLPDELDILRSAAKTDWSQVNPAIFGTLFQNSMNAAARHAAGAHFTAEVDILRVITPTLLRPWEERIHSATTPKQLVALREELVGFRVLDPACGSGNFLYVAFRSLVRLELQLLAKLRSISSESEFRGYVQSLVLISPEQFFGIDRDPFGIELAKVTLLIAKKLSVDDARDALGSDYGDPQLAESVLPFDNLDGNFQCTDALFATWPSVDAFVSNPPFQSKNKMQKEFGRAYVNRLRKAFPHVSGRADYCVYWFRRAHDLLAAGQRAGMVGTNTITQNYSRESGLDYIVANGGEIVDAVSTQVWSGDAVVHVSIVNWIKGTDDRKKRLSRQLGDLRTSPWETKLVDHINSALSWDGVDVSGARTLAVASHSGGCFQGQTHGSAGFLLPEVTAQGLIKSNPTFSNVLFPYLTADDVLGRVGGRPSRYVIDFGTRDVLSAQSFTPLFRRVEDTVLASRQESANAEQKSNSAAIADDAKGKTGKDHAAALAQWWLLFRRRGGMLEAIGRLPRYIVCGRVTKRPIFEFVSSAIHPNDALMVFPYADDYSFGILQSGMHADWFRARCSTLKGDARYTSNTVFDTFCWPQSASIRSIKAVAAAAVGLRTARRDAMVKYDMTLRELYRTLDKPGKHPVRSAQAALDAAVRAAYGVPDGVTNLAFMAELNAKAGAREKNGLPLVPPGLPSTALSDGLITNDCILP